MLIAVIVALSAWLLLLEFERRNVFKPERAVTGIPADLGLEFEEIRFVAEDNVPLTGWWIPAPDARGTVLYCHGNAGNIGTRAQVGADLHALGVNVFLFDYRGYGRSGGRCSEAGTYRDARAAYEVVRARYDDADEPPVVVYGGSLGGAIAVQLALDRPVRGLVLENTFTSVPDLGERIYPWLPIRLLGNIRYPTLERIHRVTAPLLVAHSRDDELIPCSMGQLIFNRARHPKTFVELRGAHSEATWPQNPAFARELDAFLARCLKRGG